MNQALCQPRHQPLAVLMATSLLTSTAQIKATARVAEAARCSALAAHSAAGLAAGIGHREAARLLRAAEALSRSAAAVLQAPCKPVADAGHDIVEFPADPSRTQPVGEALPPRQRRRRAGRKRNQSGKKDADMEAAEQGGLGGEADVHVAALAVAPTNSAPTASSPPPVSASGLAAPDALVSLGGPVGVGSTQPHGRERTSAAVDGYMEGCELASLASCGPSASVSAAASVPSASGRFYSQCKFAQPISKKSLRCGGCGWRYRKDELSGLQMQLEEG